MGETLPELVVAGAGAKGTGIASVFGRAGWKVTLFDINQTAAAEAAVVVRTAIQTALSSGEGDRTRLSEAVNAVRAVQKPGDLRNAALVIETVAENLEVKRRVLGGLEEHIGPDTLLTTNTGWLSVNEVCAQLRLRGRTAGFHFLTPASTPVVEIIPTLATTEGTADRLETLARGLGHAPIRSADLPGFVVAHLNRGLMGEAARLHEGDVAPPRTIDQILTSALGLRSGPFQLYDRLGLDVLVRATDHIWRGWGGEPRFRGVPLLATRAAAGLTGRDGAPGFYADEPARLEPPQSWNGPVFVSRRHPDLADAVCACLRGAHLVPQPSASSLNIVTPVGTDLLGAIDAEGLDPVRSVGIDAVFLGEVVTLAATSVTRTEIRRGALALFQAAGRKPVIVRDTPGLVAQRTAAMIIAVGYAMLDKGVATAIDIETAATQALGYREGPFGLSRRIGLGRSVLILETLLQTMGDPRWRVPVNLRHAALLAGRTGGS